MLNISARVLRRSGCVSPKRLGSFCFDQRRQIQTPSSGSPVPTRELVSQPKWMSLVPHRARPYVMLARLDKPIGTLLLYYPCSTWAELLPEPIVYQANVWSLISMGHFNGFEFSTLCTIYSALLSGPFWHWCIYNARRWLYHQ